METSDSDDGLAEIDSPVSTRLGNNILTNGNVSSSHSLKIEQEGPPSCSSAASMNHMMPMVTTAVINQGSHLSSGIMHVTTPASVPEQLVVTVQNMNGTSGMEENEAKSMINQSSINNSIQMSKLNNAIGNGGAVPAMTAQGQVLATTQLANMMSLASLPQVTTIPGMNGIPGLNVVGQLASPTQMMQTAPNMVNPCVSSSSIQGTCQPQMSVAVNGQTHSMQSMQQPQIANTPQFILAAGQPIQGIQGAQLLIPTSSGVATQQVITIPVSQLAGNQVVQLVASNGQIFTTTLANLQALSQPVPVPGINPTNIAASTQTVQSHPMLATTGYTNIQSQMTALPQIFTNSAGQLVTLGPQIIAHPLMSANHNANIMVNPQMAATHLQQIAQPEDKTATVPTVAHANGQLGAVTNHVQNTSLGAISQALAMQQSQAAHIALNPVTMVTTTQLSGTSKPPPNAQNGSAISKISTQPGTVSTLTQTVQPQPPITPGDSDSENGLNQAAANTISNTEANVVDGINLEEIKEFAKAFKIRRLSLGLTQTQVGQALSATEGPSYSQSAICRFEKLDITPRSAQRIKPVLERWMKEAEERYKNGAHTLTEFIGSESTKKRKRRTSFTPAALEVLNKFFEKNTHPSGVEMTELAEHLYYDREVVRVWFCNKRQALKNTIKKLKGGVL